MSCIAFVLNGFRCLPARCPEHMGVTINEQTGEITESRPKEWAKKLDFASWLVAFDTYAMLAAGVGQIGFLEAMRYKAVIIEARAASA